MSRLAILLALAGCPRTKVEQQAPLADQVSAGQTNVVAALVGELQDEVLQAYDRPDDPQSESSMLDPKIGPARIGVGPGDFLIAQELERAPSRWPLFVDRETPTSVRSKNLAIGLAGDRSAAWVSDEISWRIGVCGRTAVIPLRYTALYARDHDRWIQVFEHVSFARPLAGTPVLVGREVVTAVISGDLRDELSGVLSQGLFNSMDRNMALLSHDAIVIGPDVPDEWRGPDVVLAKLPGGKLEDRRIGTVGPSAPRATVAYWVGNYDADAPPRPNVAPMKVRLRVSFVFQNQRLVTVKPGAAKRRFEPDKSPESKSCAVDGKDCRWVLVSAHVSQPIVDLDLASSVFGSALLSKNLEGGEPLRVSCDDGSKVKPPPGKSDTR